MVSNLSKKLASPQEENVPVPKPVVTTRPLYDPIAIKSTVNAMGPIQLDQLERNLLNIEMDRMLTQQTACVLVGNAPPQPVFVEHFVSVAEVKKVLLPDYDMLADKWLFQRLTRTFDKKLIKALPEKNLVPHQVISININVETIFDPVFDQFINKIRLKNHQPLILEMKLFDVISDIQKYYDAREKLNRLGCRITLDAIDIHSLAVMDRELLAVDFLKINWKPDYKKIIATPMEQKIVTAIAAHGKMRIILCHCDSQDALDFGNAVGIHMFQGFLIDKKLKS